MMLVGSLTGWLSFEGWPEGENPTGGTPEAVQEPTDDLDLQKRGSLRWLYHATFWPSQDKVDSTSDMPLKNSAFPDLVFQRAPSWGGFRETTPPPHFGGFHPNRRSDACSAPCFKPTILAGFL